MAARGHIGRVAAGSVLDLGSLRPASHTQAHLGSRYPVVEHNPIHPAVHSNRFPIVCARPGRNRRCNIADRSGCRAVRRIHRIRHIPRPPRILHNFAACMVHAAVVGIVVLAAPVAARAVPAIAHGMEAGATPGSCHTAVGVPWLRRYRQKPAENVC